MKLVCGRCHAQFEADDPSHARCPNCKASAGLEPQHAASLPLQAFGLLLFVCVGLAVTSLGLVMVS